MISASTKIMVAGRSALAGPAVRDRAGNLLVLTSRALLSLGSGPEVLGERDAVGRRPTAYFNSEGPDRSAARLVGWFTPTVNLARSSVFKRTAIDLCDLLSRDVRIPAIGKGIVGYISGMNCYARFAGGAVMKDLLRVTLDRKTALRNNEPVAGSVVTLRDHSLVGVIVGIQDAELLIAPIAAVLSTEGFELATAEDIEAHNQRMNPKRSRSRRDYPDAASRIAGVLGLSGDSREDWSVVIKEWAASGWRRHQQRDPNAFAPYQSLFKGIATPDDFAVRLCTFGLTELQGHSIDGFEWEEVLRRAYTSIGLDQTTDFPGPPAISLTVESKAELSGQSSHDRVVRY